MLFVVQKSNLNRNKWQSSYQSQPRPPSFAPTPPPPSPRAAASVCPESYEVRRMGDAPAAAPELCQVWSVNLDAVNIRSSRCSPQQHAQVSTSSSGQRDGNSSAVPGAVPGSGPGIDPEAVLSQVGSRLLRDGGSLPGDVTVEVGCR